jgi:hypothetical protein
MASKEAHSSAPDSDIWTASRASVGDRHIAIRGGMQPSGDPVMPRQTTGDEPGTGVWSDRLQGFAEAIRPTPAQRAEERRIIADALRRVHGERSARNSSSSS